MTDPDWRNQPHEIREDVDDASMCLCGLPIDDNHDRTLARLCQWCGHPRCDGAVRNDPHHALCCLDRAPAPCWGSSSAILHKIMRDEAEDGRSGLR